MIGGWTEIFFRRHDLRASSAAAGAMVATTGAYVVAAGRVDRAAWTTATPLLAWLGFATLLTERIRERNPPAISQPSQPTIDHRPSSIGGY